MAAAEQVKPQDEVAWTFAVSLPTVGRWLRQRRETSSLAPKPLAVKRAALPAALPVRLATHADVTLEEQCSW